MQSMDAKSAYILRHNGSSVRFAGDCGPWSGQIGDQAPVCSHFQFHPG